MENTCMLTVLPVIPKWKIYNSVQKRPIKYCAILKEKREFQNLLENVFSKNVKNSCFIIDKKIDTSTEKSSLEIIFLNQVEKDLLLSLNLTVSEKHALRRRNNLLVFLKNNANNLKCHVQDGSIFVKCDVKIQWHIFYNLFEFLLVKYGICNIGALFYCVLFSGCMLNQEIRFLHCNPADTNHTSFPFLPNSHESGANKKPCLTSNKLQKRDLSNYFNDSFIPTDSQELTCKILSGSIPNNNNTMDMNSDVPKRKIPRLDCFCSEIHCKCHEAKWKIHKNISKYNVNCYMDLLLKKGVTSTDELSIARGESSFSSTFGNFSNQDFDSSLFNAIENSVNPIELMPKKSVSESQSSEKYSQNPGKQCENSTRNTVSVLTNNTVRNKLEPKPESLMKAMDLLNKDMSEKENFYFLLEGFSNKKKCTTPTTAFDMFRTASGKNVNISGTALKAAEKMFTEVMQTKEDSVSDNECINMLPESKFSMFRTASGKDVNISDTALNAAEKMFTEVMQSVNDSVNDDKCINMLPESEFKTKKSISPSIFHSAKLPESGRDKPLNESMDGMLVDGFFEDICFDEGLTDSTQTSSMCSNKLEKSSVGKVRKSLGGRRSLKPYSKKSVILDDKNL